MIHWCTWKPLNRNRYVHKCPVRALVLLHGEEKNRSLVSEKVNFLSVRRSNSTYRMLTSQEKKTTEIYILMEALTAFSIVATWAVVSGESRTSLMRVRWLRKAIACACVKSESSRTTQWRGFCEYSLITRTSGALQRKNKYYFESCVKGILCKKTAASWISSKKQSFANNCLK